MDRISTTEYFNKPSRPEVFRCLFDELMTLISVFRWNDNLDSEHLDIFAEEFLHILCPDIDVNDFIKTPKFTQSRQILIENLKTSIGWEIYMRLKPSDRFLIDQNLENVEQMEWDGLIDFYTNVMCEASLTRKYLKRVSGLQSSLYDSQRKIVKSVHREFSSVMQRPMLRTHSVEHQFAPIPIKHSNDLYFKSSENISSVFKTSDIIFNHYLFNLGVYRSNQSLGMTSGLINDKSKFDFLKGFINFIQLLKSEKDFNLNRIQTLFYGDSEGKAVLYPTARIGANWMERMIDSYLFNYDVVSIDDWNNRLRIFQNYLEILLPSLEDSLIELNLDTSRNTFRNLNILDEYNISSDSISRSMSSDRGIVLHHVSDIYILIENDCISTYKEFQNNLFIHLQTIHSQSNEVSGVEISSYMSVLSTISKLCVNSERFECFASDENTLELVLQMVKSRINKLVESAFLLPTLNSSRAHFTGQILSAHDVSGLYEKYLTNKYAVFQKLILDFITKSSILFNNSEFLTRINRNKLSLKRINIEFIGDTRLLKFIEMIKNKKHNAVLILLDEMSPAEIEELVKMLCDYKEYSEALYLEVSNYRTLENRYRFDCLLELDDYKDLEDNIHLIKFMCYESFVTYLDDPERLSEVILWIENMHKSFIEFTQEKWQVDSDMKPLTFNYILDLIETMCICNMLPKTFAQSIRSEYQQAYTFWSEQNGLKTPTPFRWNMIVLTGNTSLSDVLTNKNVYNYLKKDLIWYVMNRPEILDSPKIIKLLWDSYCEVEKQLFLDQLESNELICQFYRKLCLIIVDEDFDLKLRLEKSFTKSILNYYKSISAIMFSKKLFRRCGLDIIFDAYISGEIESKFSHACDVKLLVEVLKDLIDLLSKNHLKACKSDYTAIDLLNRLQT